MKLLANTLCAILFSLATACMAVACSGASATPGTNNADSLSHELAGTWQRDISDPELGITGRETLTLFPDSSMLISNSLTMELADSSLRCTMSFTTEIKGRWQEDDRKISLISDPTTYIFNADSTERSATDVRTGNPLPAEAAEKLFGQLAESLSDLYLTTYSESPEITIEGYSISGDGVLKGYCGSTAITWTRP